MRAMAARTRFSITPWRIGAVAFATAIVGGDRFAVQAQSIDPQSSQTWLRRAWERHQAISLTESARLALEDFERDPSRGPSDQVRRVMSRYQPALSMMRRAANQPPPPPVSIAVDAEDSSFPSFEQLTSSWQLSQGVRRDLLIRLNDEDAYGAIERLHTLFRVVDQTARAETLENSLVAADLFNLADAQIDLVLDYHIMGPTEASAMLAILKRLDADDPMRFISGVRHEAEAVQQWLSASFTGENGLKTFAAEFGDVATVAAVSKDDSQAMTQADLDALVAKNGELLDRMVSAFESKDGDKARASLIDLEKRAADELGVFENVMRITSRTHDRFMESRQRLLRRTVQLQSIADGSIDPLDLANAAVRYIRATVVLGQLGDRVVEPIRLYAVDHAVAADAEVTKALEKAQPVIAQLAEGAKLRRCDFTFARAAWPLSLRHYHAGLRDAARVLHADAARLIHEQKYAEAADRLVIGYRLADHLQNDRSLTASLVAFEIFRQTDDLVSAAMDGKWFDEASLTILWKAVEPISDVDAFSFARAKSDAHSSFDPWLTEQRRSPAAAPSQPESTVKQLLEPMDGERLLWLGLIRDSMQRPSRFRDRNLADEMFALRDVLPQESIRDAMLQADAVRLLIHGGQYLELSAVEMPTLPEFTELAPTANQQVRAARDRLKPAPGRPR